MVEAGGKDAEREKGAATTGACLFQIVEKEQQITDKQAEIDQKQAEYDDRWAKYKEQVVSMQMLDQGGGIALLSTAENI